MLDTVKINHVQHISFTQSRLTDAVSVILSELLSYEHPSNGRCLQQIISTLCTGEGRFAAAVLYGYSFETTNELANELLNRGGMDHTMWTINLILLAVAYGGALERCGCVEALFGKLKHHLHSVGSLILAIANRINNCKNLFPIWLNWSYIRQLFIMPGGTTEKGAKGAAADYYAHRQSHHPRHALVR